MSSFPPDEGSRPHDSDRAHASALAQDAHRLAVAAATLGHPDWAESAARLARATAPAPAQTRPTYRALALTGVAVVVALAHAGRWTESQEQAEFLARYFRSADMPIRMVAGEAFGGLAASAATSDPDGVHDFAELALEVLA